MLPTKHMTAAEAAVLDAQLPAGLTEEMRDVAFCLFEAMALMDHRLGQERPGQGWINVLESMANVAVRQLQHLADKKGGKAIYLAKGLAVYLSARDLQMCADFKGNNYDLLAKRYDLTEMRVRQIIAAWRYEQFRTRQGRLPGFDSED